MQVNSGYIRILLIEDEEYDAMRVQNTLKHFEHQMRIEKTVNNGTDAVAEIAAAEYDVVIMDYQISSGIMGEALISAIKNENPALQIIVITKLTLNISNIHFANELIKAGAFWYCTKYPGDLDYIYQPTDFALAVFNAYQKKQLITEKMRTDKKKDADVSGILQSKKIIGESKEIIRLLERIDKCADSEAGILITGKSGTGKELVAVNIHYKSRRKFENFVSVNCGSLPSELVESELFGYEKGAFTGADKHKQGLFELADKGTLFLDEIAELPLKSQVKLLRILQEGEVEKIGRTKPIKVDVRIICATNKNLQEEVVAGRFREDLYFRLNIISINVPRLEERKEDIAVLADHFIRIICNEMKIPIMIIDDDALLELKSHPWPGNVRELKNTIHRLLFEAEGKITGSMVKEALLKIPEKDISESALFRTILNTGDIINYHDSKRLFKIRYIGYVRSCSQSDAEAAEKLGLAPPNYHRLCKELGIKS